MRRARVFSSVIVVFIVISPCLSQTSKGDLLVGASLNYGYPAFRGPGYQSFYSVGFSPSVSRFFTDRFAAGLIVPFSYGKTTGLSFEYLTIHSYTIGPTMRYYFPVMKRWVFFPQVDYAIGWQTVDKDSDSGDSGTFTSSSYLLRLGLGSSYGIAKSIGLDGIISLQSMGGRSGSNGPSVNLALGLQVYLAGR